MQRLSSVSMRTAAARAVSGGAPRAHRVAHAPLALQARVARPALTLIASSERHQACRSLCTTKVTGDGSHSDFAAQSKVAPDQELRSFLDKAVKEHDVLLFMKGTPAAPKCGFSAQVVRALQNEGVDFSSADVLSSDDIRQGIKDYSDWPTVPQLYVSGEFVGGCDIIMEMHTSEELKGLLAPIVAKQKAEKKDE